MTKIMTILALMAMASTSYADSECLLEGGGQFNLTCENSTLGIQIELSGESGNSLQATRVDSAKVHYVPDLEKDLPLISFERLEEGVFAAQIRSSSQDASVVHPYLDLTAIPASVKMDEIRKLTQPQGAVESSGTFTGRLDGLFNVNSKDYETTRVNTKVSCAFNFVRCPR